MTASGDTSERDRSEAALATARAREDATRQILHLINRHRDDEMPVFRAILEQAERLCHAQASGLQLVNGARTHLRYVIGSGDDRGSFVPGHTFDLSLPLGMCIAVREARVVHVEDLKGDRLYREGQPDRVRLVDEEGVRTQLSVPLIRDGVAFGNMTLSRTVQKPFAEDEIALVETFAEHAVIAIENVRQFRAVQTQMDREAATREVLEVISRSRSDETLVFETILENAARLCNAPHALLLMSDEAETRLELVASNSARSRFIDDLRENPHALDNKKSAAVLAYDSKITQHVPDVRELFRGDDRAPQLSVAADVERMRTVLLVPLVSGGRSVGVLSVYKLEVAPFSEGEVALVETFAEQAVIAIEKVRQYREVQTRLEREAATRGILEVISQSRDDTGPVFDAILRAAAKLCDAPLAFLSMANDSRTSVTVPAYLGVRSGFAEVLDAFVEPFSRTELIAVRPIVEGEVAHIADIADHAAYRARDPRRVQMVEVEGARTAMGVPLLQNGQGIGAIVLYRREVKPFSADQIELVRTFAEQAVIAIENVRQNREVQDSLARQTATSEVLQVINASHSDLQPVFEAIAARSAALCNAAFCMVLRFRDGMSEFCASHGYDDAQLDSADVRAPIALKPDTIAGRVAAQGTVVWFENTQEPSYHDHKLARDMGIGAAVGIPIRTSDGLWGCISLGWPAGYKPSDADIELVRTFAGQAGIAIMNVALFNETQDRLEREKATRTVLEVISRSRDDDLPVFDTILENAARLCGAVRARLMLVDEGGAHLRAAGQWGEPNPAMPDGMVIGMIPEMAPVRCILEKRVINVEDARESEGYRKGVPQIVRNIDSMQARSVLAVPLIKDDEAIGCIVLTDRAVAAYDDNDAVLVQTFAAQAVIAIENVRQFRALAARTAEVEALNAGLETRVAEQVDELERMGRLKRFLSPQVAEAVVSSGDDAMLGSHRALIAILFCDIRGFTAFCESAEPEEAIEVLQTYHESLGRLIHACGAGFDTRAGDGIMVVFNDPIPCDDPAGDALRLAVSMRNRMDDLCRDWRKLGHKLGFGVGLSLGYATVGMVGSEGRYDYTASGTAVNLAARLCDHAEDREILLSPRAAAAVEDLAELEPAGSLDLKGFHTSVDVARVAGLRNMDA